MTVAGNLTLDNDIDQTIGFNVHGLLYRRRNSQTQLALALGITPSVLSKKLRGESSWSAKQVAVTAAFLNVEPGRLYAEVTAAYIRAKLRAIQGNGHTGPRQSPLLTSL